MDCGSSEANDGPYGLGQRSETKDHKEQNERSARVVSLLMVIVLEKCWRSADRRGVAGVTAKKPPSLKPTRRRGALATVIFLSLAKATLALALLEPQYRFHHELLYCSHLQWWRGAGAGVSKDASCRRLS